MVPFTPLAFFPGTIKHGNEIMVLLGENYFVKRTASQSQEIAARRIEYVDTQISKLKEDISQMKTRLDFQDQLEKKRIEDDVVEITEEYHSDEETTPPPTKSTIPKPKDNTPYTVEKSLQEEEERQRIMQRLAELEEAEEEADEDEFLDEVMADLSIHEPEDAEFPEDEDDDIVGINDETPNMIVDFEKQQPAKPVKEKPIVTSPKDLYDHYLRSKEDFEKRFEQETLKLQEEAKAMEESPPSKPKSILSRPRPDIVTSSDQIAKKHVSFSSKPPQVLEFQKPEKKKKRKNKKNKNGHQPPTPKPASGIQIQIVEREPPKETPQPTAPVSAHVSAQPVHQAPPVVSAKPHTNPPTLPNPIPIVKDVLPPVVSPKTPLSPAKVNINFPSQQTVVEREPAPTNVSHPEPQQQPKKMSLYQQMKKK